MYRQPPLTRKFYEEIIKKHVPDAQIKLKSESWLMRLVGRLVKPFNPTFSERYYTTLGKTIYIPDALKESSDLEILEVIMHELQHLIDYKKYWKVPYVLIYGFPQIFAGLSLLSLLSIFFGPIWLLWLISLVLLAPLPAPGRYLMELNGYRTSYIWAKYIWKQEDEVLNKQVDDFIVSQLSTKWYYFTFPFEKFIRKHAQDKSWMQQERYQELIKFIQENINP